MHMIHDSLALDSNLNRIAVVSYLRVVACGGTEVKGVNTTLRPFYCLIIYELFAELPFLKRHAITLLVFNKARTQISFDFTVSQVAAARTLAIHPQFCCLMLHYGRVMVDFGLAFKRDHICETLHLSDRIQPGHALAHLLTLVLSLPEVSILLLLRFRLSRQICLLGQHVFVAAVHEALHVRIPRFLRHLRVVHDIVGIVQELKKLLAILLSVIFWPEVTILIVNGTRARQVKETAPARLRH